MDEESKNLLRETLAIFRTGVQFAVTASCLAIGTSLGAIIVSGSRLAGSLGGLALALLIGIAAGATASYWMFRAESQKIQQMENPGGQNSTDHAADYSNQQRFGL